MRTVELLGSSLSNSHVPRPIEPLPSNVEPVLHEFRDYAFGSEQVGTYLRCPGPSQTNPAGFLSIGLPFRFSLLATFWNRTAREHGTPYGIPILTHFETIDCTVGNLFWSHLFLAGDHLL